MEIQASIVEIYRTHHGRLIVREEHFGVVKAAFILIDFHTQRFKIAVERPCYNAHIPLSGISGVIILTSTPLFAA